MQRISKRYGVPFPLSMKIQQVQNSVYSGYGLEMRYTADIDAIQLDMAYAGLISKSLAWGVSLSAGYTNMLANTYYSITAVSATTTEYRNIKDRTVQPIVKPGLIWKANSWYNIGVTAEIRLPLLLDDHQVFVSSTNSSTPTDVVSSSSSYKSDTPVSYALSLGQMFQVWNSDVLLDVNYTASYDYIGQGGVSENSPEVWIYNLGWRPSGKERWKPALGFSYGSTTTAENYVYTGGIIVNERSNELVLGAYFQRNQPKVANSMPNNTIGPMFSSNVIY